ncbi:hypothetical protein ACP4OV_002874 [Aristida adscensionis]
MLRVSSMSPTSIALLGYLAVLCLLPHFLHAFDGVDFRYNGFQNAAANLSLNGSALVLSSGALQLTTDSKNLMGHAFLASPVQAVRGNAVVSFSTAFVFDIVTVGPGGGHGLAFVVSASRALPGASPEQYLGLLGKNNLGNSSNHVFAVEFDTVQDLSNLEKNDNHVGVDLNSLVSNVSEPAAYFTDDDGRNVSVTLESAQPIQAWVDYDGRTKVLNVTIAPVSVSSRPRRPLISRAIDLLPIFKQEMYVGFSAATGKLASSHYILAWSFHSGDGAAQPIDLSQLPRVPKLASPPPSRSTVIKIVAVSCVVTLAVIVAAVAVALWLRRRAVLAETLEEWEQDNPHRLPYRELYVATKGFKASELLGAGGFGKVYRGVLRRSGDVVAIKRISSSGTQGMREFVTEVASLGRMRHRNLVELRGWCKRGEDLLLVYEFMPNGSLDARLFGRAGEPPCPVLTWEQRVRVLRGVASGLLYLHEEWEQVVVHRDVKASNVLLGADMGARLGDFGLARLYEHGADPATTRVAGTLGYMAPELTVTARATTATDVFAYGALLLEVATGRRPIDLATGENLLRWVRDHGARGDLVRAVDERLDGRYDKEEAKLVLWLGLMCSQARPAARPSMRQVCQYLDGELDVEEEAALVFSDADSVDFGSLTSLSWTSCNTMSAGSLMGGR